MGAGKGNPPRIPACGSPLDPVGDVHPGTRPVTFQDGWTERRLALASGYVAGNGSAVAPQGDAAEVQIAGPPKRETSANWVTVGREGPPNTAPLSA